MSRWDAATWIDAAILTLLVIWFVCDRCNLYLRRGKG